MSESRLPGSISSRKIIESPTSAGVSAAYRHWLFQLSCRQLSEPRLVLPLKQLLINFCDLRRKKNITAVHCRINRHFATEWREGGCKPSPPHNIRPLDPDLFALRTTASHKYPVQSSSQSLDSIDRPSVSFLTGLDGTQKKNAQASRIFFSIEPPQHKTYKHVSVNTVQPCTSRQKKRILRGVLTTRAAGALQREKQRRNKKHSVHMFET